MNAREEKRKLVQVQLPVDLVRQIDHLSIDWEVYRGAAIERLLREALERYKRPAAPN